MIQDVNNGSNHRAARPKDFASSYLQAGLSVIPIRADATKAPAMGTWKQHQSKRLTVQELDRQFLSDNLGVAIIHGKVSGNTEVIDIDEAEVFEPFREMVCELRPDLIEKLWAST